MCKATAHRPARRESGPGFQTTCLCPLKSNQHPNPACNSPSPANRRAPPLPLLENAPAPRGFSPPSRPSIRGLGSCFLVFQFRECFLEFLKLRYIAGGDRRGNFLSRGAVI